MVRVPILAICLIPIIFFMIPLQSSFGSIRTLELTLYADGSAHVTFQLEVNTLEPDFEVELLGTSIENLVAVSENGFSLSNEINGSKAVIDTFGSSLIDINYHVHDLISKEGRIWTFSLDSQNDYTVVMPPNSIIVGMNAFPENVQDINDLTILYLRSGLSEINYIFGSTIYSPTISSNIAPEPIATDNGINTILIFAIIGIISITIIVSTTIIVKRTRNTKSAFVTQTNDEIKSHTNIVPLNIETILSLRPEMREDDKEIVKFIFENNGQVLESELRKKFLQPRTTMWRAVKRLERQGVIEIYKKNLQNLVKIRKDLAKELDDNKEHTEK